MTGEPWLYAALLAFGGLQLLVVGSSALVDRPRRAAGAVAGEGTEVDADRVVCPDCEAVNERGYRYCRECVTELPDACHRSARPSPEAGETCSSPPRGGIPHSRRRDSRRRTGTRFHRTGRRTNAHGRVRHRHRRSDGAGAQPRGGRPARPRGAGGPARGGLDWERARENFYAAAREGLDADLEWITVGGEETTHDGTIYGEVFEYARDGLELRGLSRAGAEEYLRPLRTRFRKGAAPADWKRRAVRRRFDDGTDFEEAVYGMQREYVRRQADTLLEGTFADWLRD